MSSILSSCSLFFHFVPHSFILSPHSYILTPSIQHVLCYIIINSSCTHSFIMSSILSLCLHSSDFLHSLILSSVILSWLHYIIYSPSNHHFLHSIILPPFYDVSSTPSFKLKHSESVSTFPWSTLHNLYPGEKQWGPGDLWVLFSEKKGE